MTRLTCILLIDDNPADNIFHKIRIKEANVCDTIQIATNGPMALAYLAKAGETDNPDAPPRPDLIFLDINLPGMDGFDFLDEYHQLAENLKSTAIIVMLTTSLNPDDRQRALRYSEVSDFENKPLTVAKIKTIIATYF